MTVTCEAPLSIAGAAARAHCSRSTIERGLAAYRRSQGASGLPHRKRPPGERYAAGQPAALVEIDPADLQRWLKGLPPRAERKITPVAA